MYEEINKKEKKARKKKENRFINKNTKKNQEESPVLKMEEEKEPEEKVIEEEQTLSKEEPIKEDTIDVKEETENKNKKNQKVIGFKTDWVSILVKLGLFLLVAFFIIFIVTKIRQGFGGNSFTKNLEKMKEVAYIYYKVDTHRPLSSNEEVTMTLKDMEDANLIKELKDSKNNVCSKEYSYVSLTKKTEENYDLNVYLSCGGESQSGVYEVTYKDGNPESENPTTTTLYELKRNVTTNSKYSCPEGYLNAGKYCVQLNQTDIKAGVPIYRIIPERDTVATFKRSDTEYVYADPILISNPNNYKCPSGYTLINNKCVYYTNAKVKNNTSYSCPNGGTLTGTKCMFTTYTNYNDEQAYCKQGRLVNNDECYVTKEYSVRCINGKKDSSRNSCYTTYTASKELSDWLFDGKVTYSSSKNVKDTDTVMYEYDYDLENGKVVYKRYIRKYIKVCDEDDVLSGNICKHYDTSYLEKYCTGNYDLNSDQTECYTYMDASYKHTNGTYTCPQGYTKKGSGANSTCYKYENAVKTTTPTYSCSSGYDLTKDNQCVKTINATPVTEENYECPSGYTKKGSGKNTICYKKTSTESYYYCSNVSATLKGNRCYIPSKTEFLGYRCPNGYENSGSQCVDVNHTNTIYATETDGTNTTEETIWSRSKEVDGWTWTGNTKEE